MRPQFDERDASILMERETAYNERQGPRVGDFIIRQDGKVVRFAHDWGDGLQTSLDGSIYLGKGYASFSGGLDQTISLERIAPTEETRDGSFWFFHHDMWTAHNGVHFKIMCRVYQEGEE